VHSRSTCGLAGLLAEASQAARQKVVVATEREQALVDVAAGVAAPALFGYVLWLLRRAQDLKIQRLYFLSRDGLILLQIARQLQELFPCESRYLYSSRVAWCLPSLSGFDAALLDKVLPVDYLYTVESTFLRLGLDPEVVAEELSRINLPRSQWHDQLTAIERENLHKLLESPAFQVLVRSRAEVSRPMLSAYLHQEGLWDDVRWAIVDLGWQGSIQNALGRILASENGQMPHGFYYGISGGEPDNRLDGVREAYLGDARHQASAGDILDAVIIPLEVFCAADHGTVAGYETVDNQLRPILQPAVNAPLIDWGLPLVQQTIQNFMEALVPRLSSQHLEADLRPAIMDLINAFWKSPSTFEAHSWGDYWCEERKQCYQLAPPYNARHLIQALTRGKIARSQTYWWHEGSLARTPIATRLPLSLLTYMGRMVKRIYSRRKIK
jgi:hypothetical protein